MRRRRAMSNPPNQDQPAFTGSSKIGSHIISVHTERKVRVYAVYEPELDSLSLYNNATTVCSSLATFFLSFFIDNIRELTPNYIWYFDPFAYTAFVFAIVAGLAIFFKMGITKKIKEGSTTI
jgi:hypothetical protein